MSIFNWSNSLTLLFFWSALLIVRSRCPDCQGAFSLLHVQFVLTDSSLVSEFGENSWGVQLTGANAKWVPLEGGGWQNWLFCHPFLTAGGIHEVEEIGKLLFTYIGMLQKVGVKEWILDAWLSTSVGRRFSRVFFPCSLFVPWHAFSIGWGRDATLASYSIQIHARSAAFRAICQYSSKSTGRQRCFWLTWLFSRLTGFSYEAEVHPPSEVLSGPVLIYAPWLMKLCNSSTWIKFPLVEPRIWMQRHRMTSWIALL